MRIVFRPGPKNKKPNKPKYNNGRCICVKDYKVFNTDITYRCGDEHFYEHHPLGVYGPYYKVFLNKKIFCNVNAQAFHLNFKKKDEKPIKRAIKHSNRPKKSSSRT